MLSYGAIDPLYVWTHQYSFFTTYYSAHYCFIIYDIWIKPIKISWSFKRVKERGQFAQLKKGIVEDPTSEKLEEDPQ